MEIGGTTDPLAMYRPRVEPGLVVQIVPEIIIARIEYLLGKIIPVPITGALNLAFHPSNCNSKAG